MFSVIIPLYNKENQILRTVSSVLNQKFKDFEVIIVNDGSIDNSLSLVESIDDERIKIINQKNSGVSAARNRGILEASYDWIAFLDADDLWTDNKLFFFYNVIKVHEDIDWIFSSYLILKDDIVYKVKSIGKSGLIQKPLHYIYNGFSIQTSSVVVRRSLFLNDRSLYFTEGLNNSEDRELWYRLILKYSKVYFIKEYLSYYFIESKSNSLSSKINFSFLTMKERLANDLISVSYENRKMMAKFLEYNIKYNCLKIWVKSGYFSEFEDVFNYRITRVLKSKSQSSIMFKMFFSKILLLVFKFKT